MHKAIVMFSGGLDSVIAAHLLKSQGLDVTALHFVLPFYAQTGKTPEQVQAYADTLGVPLRVEEEGEEFLEMIRDPKFGYGKNANPCVDCRIHRVIKAGRIMEEMGAVCLATGEVVGQRPMSQKMDKMKKIEKLTGLKGKLLRPLSAKLLDPTDAELAGIVDREKLLDITGRSRQVQLAYAKEHGLAHSSPAGGCILTNIETGARFIDLAEHDQHYSLADFKLLAYGRHFRTSQNYRVIVSRNEDENDALERIHAAALSSPKSTSAPNIVQMYLRDTLGPLALGIGEPDESGLQFAASAVMRFSRLRNEEKAAVVISGSINGNDINRILETKPANDADIDRMRISASNRKKAKGEK
ncbi:MAG: 7-cyano-7-deazaguanine synthase [Chitinispirillia bacterium]|nr:7-cyano-7-deazaguanine synthase [Chitinispirillia bacterium]MCL2242004.1 7-cyano-7-deazaguanine synthase [Chitinispirillia bacterium]